MRRTRLRCVRFRRRPLLPTLGQPCVSEKGPLPTYPAEGCLVAPVHDGRYHEAVRICGGRLDYSASPVVARIRSVTKVTACLQICPVN